VEFDDSQLVESVCYQMRQADWPRSRNRALVNQLFNGWSPFTEEEVNENGIQANFNDLTACRKAHDARGQMYSGILKPGNYFRAVADIGPRHSRAKHSSTATRHANRLLKRSMPYYELQRAKIAQAILHGIAPSVWDDQERWCPKTLSIEDALIPSGEASELPMDSLPLFAIHKSFTAPTLIRLTRGPNRDPAWNMDVVNACLKWIDRETQQLMSTNWPILWSAEKFEERIKEVSFYGGDAVPTIEVYDFFWWHDDGKNSGWKRRMIIDPWGTPDAVSAKYTVSRKKGDLFEQNNKAVQGQFLFNSKDRIYATNKSSIVAFQFADLSAVAPFRYHTLRGLGWLLHDPCSIQNRLTCKITEATFETLTMLMRVKSMEDVQRALKANLFNRGFVDENVQFIPQAERWQVNTGLVEYGYNKNRELIDQGSSSHAQNQDMSKGVEKGQLQIMAELNATTAMLSAGLLQYYQYQTGEYREIWRRLLSPKPNLSDPDVNAFRAACLRDGVPEEMLNEPEGWDIEPERVLGAGNKTLEMAIAGQLMAYRPLYDASSQREILRDVTLAITDDPARADELVPEEPEVSNTVRDTEFAFNCFMAGNPVTPKDGLNAAEVAGTILDLMDHKVQEIMQAGGVGTPADVKGFTMAAGYAAHYIQLLEQDKNAKPLATALNQKLGKVGNEIKGMQQRQQEMMQKAAAANGGAGGMDAKDKAKIQATIITAKTKADLAKQSHAQKTAQRQISFEQKLKQDAQKHQHDLAKSAQEHMADLAGKDLEVAANIKRGGMKSFEE
jgi:hypothetical protein